MNKIILLLYLLFLANCTSTSDFDPLYPIPSITIEEGKIKGIDLSVYKKKSSIALGVRSHPDLDVKFLSEKDSLYLTPRELTSKLITLSITADGKNLDLLIKYKPMVKHTFTYSPTSVEKNVIVMGGFNDWSRSALPLSDVDGDGVLERTVYLKPERHEYKFVVDGKELIDPENPLFVSNNIGGWNSILNLTDLKEKPAGRFLKDTYSGMKLIFNYLPPEDGSQPAELFVFFNNVLLEKPKVVLNLDGTLTIPKFRDGLDDGLLRITGLDEKGRVIPENHTIIKAGKPLHPQDHPDDWHFSVLYSLMVDRFLDGDPSNTKRAEDQEVHELANFYGGDFAGIIQKLEKGYFTDLGISAIWLSPVQQQPENPYVEWIPPNRKYTAYHGYWPIAPRKVDRRFGTENELRQLIDLAHDQGIKVILDFVSNHVHEDHPYFRKHREWFGHVENADGTMNIRNWSEETRLTTWFDIFLPSYDFVQSKEAIDQVTKDALWWLVNFNLDGFRQDAVKHLPHSFWRTLTYQMKQRFPNKNLYQIGETFGSDELILSYVNPGELDAQFNFAIYFNARAPFSSGEADFSHLANVIQENLVSYGPVHLMGNITSSHDQVRFMAFADGQLTFDDNGTERSFDGPPGPVRNSTSYSKLANFHAFNASLPGIPIIYYGEEIGMMGAGDPDCRRPMRFDKDLNDREIDLMKRISEINGLRKSHPSLAIGDFVPILTEGPVMVFAKVYFDEVVLVAVNHGEIAREVLINLPFKSAMLSSLLEDYLIPVSNGKVALVLKPYSNYFFELDL